MEGGEEDAIEDCVSSHLATPWKSILDGISCLLMDWIGRFRS
jgi:hypothetical protein